MKLHISCILVAWVRLEDRETFVMTPATKGCVASWSVDIISSGNGLVTTFELVGWLVCLGTMVCIIFGCGFLYIFREQTALVDFLFFCFLSKHNCLRRSLRLSLVDWGRSAYVFGWLVYKSLHRSLRLILAASGRLSSNSLWPWLRLFFVSCGIPA